ncbi:MAG TPA: DUF6457 domain-containing protein [Acidimicrobiales bacterium]|nr:DUF6457 domain-containing protein [Acidimicrobiales bacterium]
MSTVDEWTRAFASATNSFPLTEEERLAILELAGVAAHASERTAAPLTCWLAAVAGLSPVAALDIARALATSSASEDHEA